MKFHKYLGQKSQMDMIVALHGTNYDRQRSISEIKMSKRKDSYFDCVAFADLLRDIFTHDSQCIISLKLCQLFLFNQPIVGAMFYMIFRQGLHLILGSELFVKD